LNGVRFGIPISFFTYLKVRAFSTRIVPKEVSNYFVIQRQRGCLNDVLEEGSCFLYLKTRQSVTRKKKKQRKRANGKDKIPTFS
jgi:hypothetical protein